jgi:hypothetical protein
MRGISVCAGSFSPVLDRPIGSAFVASTAFGKDLFVDLRGTKDALRVAKAALHKNARKEEGCADRKVVILQVTLRP